MVVSLIVATRDRPAEFKRFVESLRSQNALIEIVVVDQSCVEAQARNLDVLVDCQRRFEHVRVSPMSVSRARNIGLRVASGQVYAFPDDDCWYPERLLDQVLANFGSQHVDIVSGRYGEPGRMSPQFATRPCRLSPSKLFGRLSSVTLFVKRSAVMRAAAAFDEQLGAGTSRPAGEEMDFVLQLFRAGAAGVYDPAIRVFHAIERESTLTCERRIARDRATTYVRLRHSWSAMLLLRTVARFGRTMIGAAYDSAARESFSAQLAAFADAARWGGRAS